MKVEGRPNGVHPGALQPPLPLTQKNTFKLLKKLLSLFQSKPSPMPLYMDLHILPGVKAKEVAEAHRRDMLLQHEHSCTCMTYWIDEKRGNVFCLIDAPDQKSVEELHSKAHGLIPHKIIEVSSNLVESFLGRIHDPAESIAGSDDLKIFDDSSFRLLLVITHCDPLLLQHLLGREQSLELIAAQHAIIRNELILFGGSEAEYTGTGFVASFTSVTKALGCARSIQQKIPSEQLLLTRSRIGLHAGEPVSNSPQIFGDTIRLAKRLCSINNKPLVAVSSTVKELMAPDDPAVFSISQKDELWLEELYGQLEKNWQDTVFGAVDFCRNMMMSSSQFYRKTVSLTGLSPNILLKEFRLEKAKYKLRTREHAVSEIAFETGFSSPSYFTKCFKKKFGLLPMAYLELAQPISAVV